MNAPRVLAKGADLIAFRIRELATASRVPIVAAPSLTRAIYHSTDIGDEVPAPLYVAIAQILAFVYQLKQYRRGAGPAPRPLGDLVSTGRISEGLLMAQAMLSATVGQGLRHLAQGNIGIPVLLLVLLAMMTLPVPPFLLDVSFTFNIALSLVVLLVSVYSLRPLDFAAFPTILLVSTLLRLALNVASTRVVLLEGHHGGDSAGKVIQAFGEVVVGGNYVVGLVVFIILVIINFVVVTKGAGRISEVSARFTLDAMPGKQMAIDADLNAGMIDQETARKRREEVGQEADFYGAMDGASKFVRGDAVAGILIMLINILGGLGIGIIQHGLSFDVAVKHYTLLTIGDGLVAQIPSLLLSTAAAIMVTRVSSEHDMGQQVINQMFTDPRALGVAAAILLILGLVPGMPHVVFIALAACAAIGARYISRNEIRRANAPPPAEARAEAAPSVEVSWDDVAPVDVLGLEVGYRLIPLVDRSAGGELLARIKGVRKKLSQELGLLVPSVHIRDNLDLLPNSYRLTLMGVPVANAEIYPDKWLAIDPGEVFGKLNGIATKDPAFGLAGRVDRRIAQGEGADARLHGGRCEHRHRDAPEPDHAGPRGRTARPRRSAEAARDPRGVRAEARRTARAGQHLDFGAAESAAEPAARKSADSRHQNDRGKPDRHRGRTKDPEALTAAVRVVARSADRADDLRPHRRARRDHARPGTRTAADPRAPAGSRRIRRRSNPAWPNGCSGRSRLRANVRRFPASRRCCWLQARCGRCCRGSSASATGSCTCLSYEEVPDNRQITVVATIGRS